MVANGPDITPDPAGVYVGNNAVSSEVGFRSAPEIAWYAQKEFSGVVDGSLWFVSDDKITRIDAITGAFQSEIPLPVGYVGIDIMPSGSLSQDPGVIWCYCRRIFIDDICRISINPANNSFNEVASVTIELGSLPSTYGGGDSQRLPGRSFGQYVESTPPWFYSAVTTAGIFYYGPYWHTPACDSERRLVWSVATLNQTGDSGIDGMLVRTNVTKPLNDGWAYNGFFSFVPPEWNSSEQKQGCSMFPLGGQPTGVVVLDDGSVFVSQVWGSYNPWQDSAGYQGLVVKFSPWIDQEVTETHETFNSNGISITYDDGPIEDARVVLDYNPNLLITDGSNVWGTSQRGQDGLPAEASIFRISGTSGELTHEMIFPGENVIDMTEGGVYLYVLVTYDGYPAQPGNNRLVKLYKSNLSIVDEMDFPHAYRLISYDSETLWVKRSMHDQTVDRMYKISKSLIGAPWWLSPSYPLGYTDVDGVERGSKGWGNEYQHGRLFRGIPGSWGGHLIFIGINEYGEYPHTLLFDPTTGYTDMLPIPDNGLAIMPEYTRGNQSGGAGFYGTVGNTGSLNRFDTEHAFTRFRFPEKLPSNSKIAICDAQHRSDPYWGYENYGSLECSVLYESGNNGDYIKTYYTTTYRSTSGYVAPYSKYAQVGIKRESSLGYGSVSSILNFVPPTGITEMRSIGTDILLYHNYQSVANTNGTFMPGNVTVIPLSSVGEGVLNPGPWFTINADIACQFHNNGNPVDPFGMILFDVSSQNVYTKIDLVADIYPPWYVGLYPPTHLPDVLLPGEVPLGGRTSLSTTGVAGNGYGSPTNSPVLMKVGPPPVREGESRLARDWDGEVKPDYYNEHCTAALYILSEDWGIKCYLIDGYGIIREGMDISISNDPNRAKLGPNGIGIRPKELITTSNGFFVLDSNNVVKRINVTPPPPTLLTSIKTYGYYNNVYQNSATVTRADVFGNDDLANVKFGPVAANEKLSHILWEFGDGTSAFDSGNGLYPSGQDGGVTTWPPQAGCDHIYAPGYYVVKITAFYGRSNSYSSPGYLGSRAYSAADVFGGGWGSYYGSNSPSPYNRPYYYTYYNQYWANGSYLTGEIDASSLTRSVSKTFGILIQSKTSAIIGIEPLAGEQTRPYISGSILDLYPNMSYMDNGTLVLNMIPTWYDEDIEWSYMVLRFFHISSYNDPYVPASNGRLEIFTQFDGASEQPLDIRAWPAFDSPIIFQKSFNSNWAADQQFIGNEFDIVARWRSSSNSSIVSATVRLRVRIGNIGVPNWSLDHIEIAPDIQ